MITLADFIGQVATIPETNEDENAMGGMMEDDEEMDVGRDSDADMAEQMRQREEYEKNLMDGLKLGNEESAEDEVVDMKGRYNLGNPTKDEEPNLIGKMSDDESPAAGSESHNYLGGFGDENDEDNNQA